MGWLGWCGEYLLELVFPTSCAGCGEYGGELICEECWHALPLLRGPTCDRCGRSALYQVEACALCLVRKPAFDATCAAGAYRDPLRAVIHRLKYRNGRRLVPMLGELMSDAVQRDRPPPVDTVTFVPMHRRKQKERGYNQAELLAREVARGLGLEARPLLCRTRPGAAQAGLELKARRANVHGAFDLRSEAALTGRPHLLLVDDVMTSGFTLSECARALKRAGAGRITCCVLARDVPGEPHAEQVGNRFRPCC